MSYFSGSEKSRFVNGQHQNFEELDNAVNNIIYELDKYDNLNQSYQLKCDYIKKEIDKITQQSDNKATTIPQYIRLGIYYIAFTECIKQQNNNFQQAEFLEKLNLSKNELNKWNLHPRKDADFYNKKLFTPPLTRKGVKKGKLCRMIQFLLTSQNAEYFADIFGGFGGVTSNVSSYFKNHSFFNEFDTILFNLLEQIQINKGELLERCRKIFDDISELKDVENPMNDFGEDRMYKYCCFYDDLLPQIFGIYQGAHKNVYPEKRRKKSDESYKSFSDWLEKLNSERTPIDLQKKGKIFIAAYTFFVHKFKVKARASDVGISGVDFKRFKDFLKGLQCNLEGLELSRSKKTSESEIYRWSETLKGVGMSNSDYREFYKDVRKKVNIKKIIWYFDPPYFLTSQYKSTFSDKDHVELIELLKEISNDGGKWVLSCKDIRTNESENKSVSNYRKKNNEDAIIGSFEKYFTGFLDNVKFVKNEGEYEISKKKRIKNHILYVYKLKKERYNEIVITNFDVPKSVVSLLNKALPEKNKIPEFTCEEFTKHFEKEIGSVLH